MFEKFEKFGAEKLNIRRFELNALSIFLICLILASVYKYFSDRSLSFEKKKALFSAIDSISKTNEFDILDEIELANDRIKLEDSKNKEFIIDINIASHLELMKLPSIGEKTAKLIIDFRNKNGTLKNEDLLDVKGIGDKTFEKILPFLKKENKKDSISDDNNLKESKELSTNTINDTLKRLNNIVLESKEKKKIDLNSASLDELKQLVGIGNVIAKRILEYRTNHKFNKIEDLMKIQGISEKKFDKVKNFIEIR